MKKNFLLMFSLFSFCFIGFSQSNDNSKVILAENYQQKSNWTKQDENNFKADCKRGLRDAKSILTIAQQDEYCDCIFNKIKINFPDKYSQQPSLEWMKKRAKECLITIQNK